jgi:formate-dependent nitrite reductase membrane component NrfD
MPGETQIERPALLPDGRTGGVAGAADPHTAEAEPSYYDISFLKAPVWKWEVAWYFYLGGLSAGAYLLARLAERVGGDRYRDLTRVGTAVAAAAAVPCAPLLILDLGDPKRFHHMLRVWKPSSPMNLGAWTLTAYSGALSLAVLREWLRGDGTDEERSLAGRVADGVLVSVADAAGVPLALLLAGYTGVLLSCNATPVWSRNPWLGPMFSAGAVGSGASATGLVLELLHRAGAVPESGSAEPLKKVGLVAHAAEALTLAGFVSAAGSLATPLTRGAMAPYFWGAVAGMATSEVLHAFAPRAPAGRWARLAASAVGLASGWAVRWGMVHAGHHSADDPRAARGASRPRT